MATLRLPRCRALLFLRTLCLISMGMCLFLFLLGDGSGKKPLSDQAIPLEFSRDLPGCLAIITGDLDGKKREVEELLISKTKTKVLSTDFYLNVTEDCPSYIDWRGFVTVPFSQEERDFPIAYSMVIHDQVEMFERLLRAIYAPQNVYCVHVDQKSPEEFHMAVQAIISCFPNVFIASKLESVAYTSWSRVQADLNCMTDLLKSHIKWRYLLNTCGTDFPIKTNGEIVKALKALKGRNSMETEETPPHKKIRWQYHFNVTTTIIRTDIKKSPPPINSPMFSGNAYIVITRDFVKHVIHDRKIQPFIEWEKDTYSPDEHMWATLQRMPSVPGSVPANIKYDVSDMQAVARAVKWGDLAGNVRNGAPYPHCTGTYRRAVCVYGAGDLWWLLNQQHLFANKFDPTIDDVAIRCLETVLRLKALGHDLLQIDHFSNIL